VFVGCFVLWAVLLGVGFDRMPLPSLQLNSEPALASSTAFKTPSKEDISRDEYFIPVVVSLFSGLDLLLACCD
jgi:hypothetical protein